MAVIFAVLCEDVLIFEEEALQTDSLEKVGKVLWYVKKNGIGQWKWQLGQAFDLIGLR